MKKTILIALAIITLALSGCAQHRLDVRMNDLGQNAKTAVYGGALEHTAPDPVLREMGQSLKMGNALAVKIGVQENTQKIMKNKSIY